MKLLLLGMSIGIGLCILTGVRLFDNVDFGFGGIKP